MWKELITFLMHEAGMSQRDIAEAVESSQQHISDLYNERRGKRIGYELAKKRFIPASAGNTVVRLIAITSPPLLRCHTPRASNAA